MNRLFLTLLLALLAISALPSWAHPGDDNKLSQLNHRIEHNPQDQQAYIARGALYSRSGKYELALADLLHAKYLGPTIAVGYQLGLYYYHQNDLTKAQQYLDTYLKTYPDFLPAQELQAKTALAQGQTALAIRYYRAFLRRSPYANPGQYIAAANAANSPQTAPALAREEALLIIDAGIERLGVVPQLQQYAIELELQENRINSALERHKTLAAVTASSPQWRVRYGELLLLAKQPKDADQQLQLAEDSIHQNRATPARQRLLQTIAQLRQKHALDE